MTTLNEFFDQFLRERVYFHNITPKTREFYETAWKAFQRAHAEGPPRPAAAPLISEPISRRSCSIFASAE